MSKSNSSKFDSAVSTDEEKIQMMIFAQEEKIESEEDQLEALEWILENDYSSQFLSWRVEIHDRMFMNMKNNTVYQFVDTTKNSGSALDFKTRKKELFMNQ